MPTLNTAVSVAALTVVDPVTPAPRTPAPRARAGHAGPGGCATAGESLQQPYPPSYARRTSRGRRHPVLGEVR